MLMSHLIEKLAASACVAASSKKHTTEQQRNAAVDAYSRAHENLAKATDSLRQEDPSWLTKDRRTTKQFIRRNAKKFHKLKTTADQYKGRTPPSPKKVPDKVAKDCAAFLKEGYIKTVHLTFGRRKNGVKREEVREYREYYNSINEACEMHPYLKKVLVERKVDAAHLLKRMHQVDPGLVIRKRDYKRALSEQQRRDRMAAAKRNRDQYEAEGDDFLNRTVWADEFAIWMVPKNSHRGVYCDAHDKGVHAVVPMRAVAKGDKVKLHILLAVNCKLGACFMEFTTGTTDPVKRLHVKPKRPYKVGGSGSSHVQPSELRCTLQQPSIAALNHST